MRVVLCLAFGVIMIAPALTRAEPPRGAVYSNLDRNCQIYSDQIIINGQHHTVYGHACLQPAGRGANSQNVAVRHAVLRTESVTRHLSREFHGAGTQARHCHRHGVRR